MTSSFRYEWRETLLDIQNISVSRGGVPVIKNLSARINNVVRPDMNQGQIVGLLGPSGIGKTTLFKVLAGLRKPDEGHVLLGASGQPVQAGDVGVVAQNYPLLSHRSVLGNLQFAAKRSGAPADVLKAYAEEFGLTEHFAKYPAQLSGGQKQRLAVAQQLLCSEHYLIMDEPFSGLDVVALEKVRKLVLGVSQRHEENTFIIVTHDVTAAVSTCDTIWLMGRDRDAQGNVIPGARIMDVIDLIEMDICWHSDPVGQPGCAQLIRDIKQRFLTL